jgi:hypothetical protein
MNNLEAITKQMNSLETQIQIEQKYIAKHGQANDAGEYDEQWEQMKEEAQRNLDKWDRLKEQRDRLKRQNLLIQNNTLVMEFMGRLPKPYLSNQYSISDSPLPYLCWYIRGMYDKLCEIRQVSRFMGLACTSYQKDKGNCRH